MFDTELSVCLSVYALLATYFHTSLVHALGVPVQLRQDIFRQAVVQT